MEDTSITGYEIYHGFLSGYLNISQNREYLNKINVFPVPDGDTGNNMVKTLKTIVTGMRSTKSATSVMNGIADLSIVGARGNSGMILSQFINGIAINMDKSDELSCRRFGIIVNESVAFAYEAMENPQEGTILSVIKKWSEAIFAESTRVKDFPQLLTLGFAAAKKALNKTPEQLKVLEENNVLDAGAWGFVSFLEGIETISENGFTPFHIRKKLNSYEVPENHNHDSEKIHRHQEIKFRYCTEVLLTDLQVPVGTIRSTLKTMGDSLIVGQGRNSCRIHIHSNYPDKVIKILQPMGNIVQQKADDMIRQEQMVLNPIAKVAILTDSIADIPREILDRYQIHVLNLKLSWDDDEYLDRLTITPEEFYRMQQSRKSFPGSSIPEKPLVRGLYTALLDHYDSVLVLPVAKALSGTWMQMTKTAEDYNQENHRITVIDTCLNSVAQGLLVVELAKAAAEGFTVQELSEKAEELKKRIRIFVSVSTFKFMVKGGRVSPLKGFMATALNLKPIISLDSNGKGMAFDKAFTSRGLNKKIQKLIKNISESNGIESYALVHADALAKAEKFVSIVSDELDQESEYISSISPIVGMHSGKGAVAIGLITSRA